MQSTRMYSHKFTNMPAVSLPGSWQSVSCSCGTLKTYEDSNLWLAGQFVKASFSLHVPSEDTCATGEERDNMDCGTKKGSVVQVSDLLLH